jgi:hypothetical protein
VSPTVGALGRHVQPTKGALDHVRGTAQSKNAQDRASLNPLTAEQQNNEILAGNRKDSKRGCRKERQ